jgi:two-component system cell cycle sensor histidine kinase/response regulator CckA
MQSSLEQFVKAAEVFPAAVVIADADGRIVLVNGKTLAMFGYQHDELVGQMIEMLIPERFRGRHVHHRNDFNAAPKTRLMGTGMDLVGRQKNGEEFPIEVSLSPAKTETGMLIVSMIQDITVRKQAEEELKQSEQRYRLLFENAVFGIFRISLSGEFLDANPALCSMLAYDSVDELIKKDAKVNVFRDSAQSATLFEELRKHDRISDVEAIWRRKDGRPITVRISGRTVRNPAGNPIAFELFAADVTHRAALEEQLRHSQKMEAVGRLADSIVHDFNNLMAVISAQGELVLELEDLRAIRQETELIVATAEKAAALTRQLLAFSRKQEVESNVVNINMLLRGNLDQILGRLLPNDVELKTVLSPELGNVLINPGHFEQVVMNLVVNARDAMPNGGRLTVETSNVELDSFYAQDHLDVTAGTYVMLAVTDNGIGISPEVRSRIFEPFFTTKGSRGNGLGLSTVYANVKHAKGHVWFYSEIGKGTTFKVYLPRVGGASELIPIESKSTRSCTHTGTILLVEDEVRLHRSIRQILEKAGYTVLSAFHGMDAIRLLEGHEGQVQLVLTDIGLPHIRGPELISHVKQLRPNVEVLYMSGFGEDGLRPQEAAQIADRFIQKPFRKDALLRMVQSTLANTI